MERTFHFSYSEVRGVVYEALCKNMARVLADDVYKIVITPLEDFLAEQEDDDD